MYCMKQLMMGLMLILLGSCASSLEYSLDAINDGDFEEAREYLLEYCNKFSKADLVYPDPRSGVSFFQVLEKLGSKEVLNEVYQSKYSRANSPFISGGLFSEKILNLAVKWNDTALVNALSARIEKETGFVKAPRQPKSYLKLVKFASIHLSVQNRPFENLTRFWLERNFVLNIRDFRSFWEEAERKKAQSLTTVLVQAVTNRVAADRDSIIKISDDEELSLISKARSQSSDKEPYNKLSAAIAQSIEESNAVDRTSKESLVNLKPRLLKASDDLSKLRQQRRDMETSGRYTYEESVDCGRCRGSSLISCHSCRGSGHCHHCDHGYVECGSCHGHGFHECVHCHGNSYILVCERVWDSCRKCYVERTVRVRCGHCHGHGRIACGCHRGRVSCGHCRGEYRCRTCRGSRQLVCPDCRNGKIIHIRKTREGEKIDRDIAGAERVFHALNSRISSLEHVIRNEKKKRLSLAGYLENSR